MNKYNIVIVILYFFANLYKTINVVVGIYNEMIFANFVISTQFIGRYDLLHK